MNLEELERAATPGPWVSHVTGSEGASVLSDAVRYRVARLVSGPYEACSADAAFIAAIRNVTPELLAVVAAARRHVESECRCVSMPALTHSMDCALVVTEVELREALDDYRRALDAAEAATSGVPSSKDGAS